MKRLNKYSLDMLRVDFCISNKNLQWFYDNLSYDTRVVHWETGSFKSYRHNFTFECDGNVTFWVGAEPNWNVKKEVYKVVTVEFNPAKVGCDLYFQSIYLKLFNLSFKKPVVKRFDVAIDIPVARSNCYLVKDNRLYEEFKKSSDGEYTQYLGQRNKHGRVKLYNKAVELGMSDNNLTRLEITCNYEERNDIERLVPLVYVFDFFQLDMSITGTDKVLMIACLQDMSLLNELSRDKKKKIKELIASKSLVFKFDIKEYTNILSQIDDYSSLV
ncbi:MAG: hypothetical protein ACRDDY_14285 [Clostridium sp.]|uniref:hypothetical protein n=1 Tax=Clostridium sp. TaxID=1506 RepID=UPI003EE69A2C